LEYGTGVFCLIKISRKSGSYEEKVCLSLFSFIAGVYVPLYFKLNTLILNWEEKILTGKFEDDFIENPDQYEKIIQYIFSSDWFRIVEQGILMTLSFIFLEHD
jgi:hypothetical protein